MKNKKAQFFGLYLVVLTLIMMAVIILIYYSQNKQVSNSLVSPVPLLILEDKKEIFEMQERNMILEAAGSFAQSSQIPDWGKQELANEIKSKFISYLDESQQNQFMEFLFSDISVDGRGGAELGDAFSAREKQIEFLDKSIYDFNFVEVGSEKNLQVTRKQIGKSFGLKAPDRNAKSRFDVDVVYLYDKIQEFSLSEAVSSGTDFELVDNGQVPRENPFIGYTFKQYHEAISNSNVGITSDTFFPFKMINPVSNHFSREDWGASGDAYTWGGNNKLLLHDYWASSSGFVYVYIKQGWDGKVILDIWVDNENYFSSDNQDFYNNYPSKDKISSDGRGIRLELESGDNFYIDVDKDRGRDGSFSVSFVSKGTHTIYSKLDDNAAVTLSGVEFGN